MIGLADLVAWWRNSSKNRDIQQFTAANGEQEAAS